MPEFALFFRMDIESPDSKPTPAQLSQYMKQWTAWIESFQAHGVELRNGNHLSEKGTVLSKGGKESRGPYVAEHQSIAGYLLVRTASRKVALEIARKCPILEGEDTSVEVRETAN